MLEHETFPHFFNFCFQDSKSDFGLTVDTDDLKLALLLKAIDILEVSISKTFRRKRRKSVNIQMNDTETTKLTDQPIDRFTHIQSERKSCTDGQSGKKFTPLDVSYFNLDTYEISIVRVLYASPF